MIKTNKFFLFAVFCFLITGHYSIAQQTHQYTLISNQPPALKADAGEDFFSAPGSTEVLGGSPAATGGTAPYGYLWQPSEDLSDNVVANPDVTTGSSDVTYMLTVTDAAGCIATDEVTLFVEVTSLTGDTKNRVSVYPNPAFERLIIKTESLRNTITLIDSQGKVVLQEAVNSTEHQIDIQAFPKGIYTLRLHNGQEELDFKVYIKR